MHQKIEIFQFIEGVKELPCSIAKYVTHTLSSLVLFWGIHTDININISG